MPRKAMDYSKTIIYKLVCNDLNVTDCYVGHTTNFTKRKNAHKRVCNCETTTEYNYKLYQIIRENGGWENWSMIQIEKYPCDGLQEATARERYYYELLKPTMNTQRPCITAEEYRERQMAYSREYSKKYYQKNKSK